MKYDLKRIMLNAWKNYRKNNISFAEALHRAWLSAKAEEINAERIERSKAAAGVAEETNTYGELPDRCPDCGAVAHDNKKAVRPASKTEIAELLRIRKEDKEDTK